MMMIFNEWAARYAANAEEFGEILGDDGKPVDDYGESCMRYFVKIATEMDEAGKLPIHEANVQGHLPAESDKSKQI
jgi:hypothetical protein